VAVRPDIGDDQVKYNEKKNRMEMFQCIAVSAFFCSRVEIIFSAGGAKESSAEFEWSVHRGEWTEILHSYCS